MNFNELMKLRRHIINICFLIIFYLGIQLLFSYLGARSAINWYGLVGIIIGYILAETIKTIYNRKGPV